MTSLHIGHFARFAALALERSESEQIVQRQRWPQSIRTMLGSRSKQIRQDEASLVALRRVCGGWVEIVRGRLLGESCATANEYAGGASVISIASSLEVGRSAATLLRRALGPCKFDDVGEYGVRGCAVVSGDSKRAAGKFEADDEECKILASSSSTTSRPRRS